MATWRFTLSPDAAFPSNRSPQLSFASSDPDFHDFDSTNEQHNVFSIEDCFPPARSVPSSEVESECSSPSRPPSLHPPNMSRRLLPVFNSELNLPFFPMTDIVNHILIKPIQLADRVVTAADEASSFRQECAELKSKTEMLSRLLRQVARVSPGLYERPMRRIIDDTEQVLFKALLLVQKCRATGVMKRVLTIIPAAVFHKMSAQLQDSIGNVSWLLSFLALTDEYVALPPMAANEPILCLIWKKILILSTESLEDRSDAAASLVSLARDNDRYGKLIIEEGGVGPLLKLLKEGKQEGQENAARAIGLLGRDPESVDHMLVAGVCAVFAKILKEGLMKVQAVVAWAVSELAANFPKCQDLFAQLYVIQMLVIHLAFETVQEHSKYAIATKATSVHQAVEDPATKSHMKAMVTRALWQLAKGNSLICKSITESRALLCFAVLLENGSEEAKYNSAMVLMEITAVAENDADLRRSAFKPDSPACKAAVDQMLTIIEKADSDLLIPCIKSVGNLARTFRATETRMIGPLVKLLDEREAEVSREAAIALAKFAGSENYLHKDHSRAIIEAGGAKHLVQLSYFGEQMVQIPALVLLGYISLHVPDSEQLAKDEVLAVLEWASKQSPITQDETVGDLLLDARSRLELYQSRGSRGFH